MQKCKNANFCSVIVRYRAVSCRIVPYRAISDIAQKNCCIFASRMRQNGNTLQYRAISCNIVQFSASRKINVVPLHQKNVEGGST